MAIETDKLRNLGLELPPTVEWLSVPSQAFRYSKFITNHKIHRDLILAQAGIHALLTKKTTHEKKSAYKQITEIKTFQDTNINFEDLHKGKDAYQQIIRSAHKDTVSRRTKPFQEQIFIVDIDYNPNLSTDGRRYIALQNIPLELAYEGDSNFNVIKGIARNNPHYQYTGSEDTLEFDVDWYAEKDNRMDVINNCRWLEALTKGDGYCDAIHRVMIIWGGNGVEAKNPIPGVETPMEVLTTANNDKLFPNMIWLLTKASYKLKQFNRGYFPIKNKSGQYISTQLLPCQAEQKLVFKRITEFNLSRAQILDPTKNGSSTHDQIYGIRTKKE